MHLDCVVTRRTIVRLHAGVHSHADTTFYLFMSGLCGLAWSAVHRETNPEYLKLICIVYGGLKNKNQLEATYYFILLLIGSTCFGHYYAHHQELATMLLITTVVVPFLVCCMLEVRCG